ncbi:MAG: hypothetical protein Q7R67_02575 [bacterium]|nr:hypothetical protein [bacterium]
MRNSIVSLSADELVSFNSTVWMMLQAIQRLVTIPSRGANEVFVVRKAVFTFRKFTDGGLYAGDILFCAKDSGEPVASSEYFANDYDSIYLKFSFKVPNGFNTEDAFSWLFTEVGKLSYAMTHGEVRPFDISRGENPPKKTLTGESRVLTYAMEFFHWGPQKFGA